MNTQEFRRFADAYGGDISRWPQDRRDAALALAAEPWAREMLAQARQTDALVAVSPAHVSPSRVGRAIGGVMARLPQRTPVWRRIPRSGRLALQTTAFALAAVLGIWAADASVFWAPETDAGMADFLTLAMSYSDADLLGHTGG